MQSLMLPPIGDLIIHIAFVLQIPVPKISAIGEVLAVLSCSQATQRHRGLSVACEIGDHGDGRLRCQLRRIDY
jgi:hypothetical protein